MTMPWTGHQTRQAASAATRRTFLKNAVGALTLPYVIPSLALGQAARSAPSARLTMGLVGLGSMGMRHVKGFLQENDCQIAAVCDVDAMRRRGAVQEVNRHYGSTDCVAYGDFRELIDRDDIDVLCIAVPDHWHGIIARVGIQAGKDIYGEKPLALTIPEGCRLVETVNRYDCVWQTGSWQRSTAHFRFGCELVRNGRIGTLQKVEIGIGGGFDPGGGRPKVHRSDPPVPMPVPEGLDYEMWLGPAPWAPYTQERCHWNFRWILDYSGGQVTDWGAHHIDIAHWGMNCDDTGPEEVVGHGVFPVDGLWNAATDYLFQCTYPGGVTMHVGSNNHYQQGVRFVGDQGWVHITRGGLQTHPQRLVKEKIGPNEVHLATSSGDHRQGHRRDFLDCVKSRAQTIAPVEVGHRSMTPAHLGNIAMILGRKICWDADKEIIRNDLAASQMLGRAMRSPWRM
jgi:predicted dehydrogenase